jgi:hypothetical protein
MTYAPEHERSYATDLSDTEWECLEPHVPPPSKRGRPRVHATRQILNAILLPVGKVLRLPLYSPSTSQVIDWLTLISLLRSLRHRFGGAGGPQRARS